MIDLHMHSTYSDGTDSPVELLKKCEELKLDYISITDHDNCGAYDEFKNINISDYFSGKLIKGIEIKCAFSEGKLIEILGYNIDTDKMQSWCDEFYKDKSRAMLQQKYFDIWYDVCIKNNIRVSPKETIAFDPNVNWASVTIYKDFIKYEENRNVLPEDLMSDFDIFSKKYTSNKNSIFYLDKSKDYPTVGEVVSTIKKCGGLAFLPHVYIYSWIENVDEHILNLVDKYKIDGIECFHSSFTNEQIEHLIDFAEKNNLYISGGTDYHGKNKPSISLEIGKGNLSINKKYVEQWVNVKGGQNEL